MAQHAATSGWRLGLPIAGSLLLVACHLPPAAAPVLSRTLLPSSPMAAASPSAVIRTASGDPDEAAPPVDADRTFLAAADPAPALTTEAATAIGFRAPAAGGVAFSQPLRLDYRLTGKGPLSRRVTIQLDGQAITDRFHAGPLDGQWLARLSDLPAGRHTLSVVTSQGATQSQTFDYRSGTPLARIVALADATTQRLPAASLKWDWGPGLLMYALARLDAHTGSHRYEPYLRAYYAHHLAIGMPTIDWSDKCSPALAAAELYEQTHEASFKAVADAVTAYLEHAKPTKAGGLNHFGTYLFSRIYPTSMWVDSLMMYDVFAARWAARSGDAALQRFAAEQPMAFARVLQSESTGLWKHAWLTNWHKAIPGTETYWLRGNGWAMVSFPEVLDVLPPDVPQRPELVQRFRRQADALLPYQGELGLWTTVLNKPDKAYLETSGTALCAYGLMHGAHRGYLPASAAVAGRKAFLGVMDRLQTTPLGPSLPEISHNTMPYPELGYTLIPTVNDMPYGLAALILAGIADDEVTP